MHNISTIFQSFNFQFPRVPILIYYQVSSFPQRKFLNEYFFCLWKPWGRVKSRNISEIKKSKFEISILWFVRIMKKSHEFWVVLPKTNYEHANKNKNNTIIVYKLTSMISILKFAFCRTLRQFWITFNIPTRYRNLVKDILLEEKKFKKSVSIPVNSPDFINLCAIRTKFCSPKFHFSAHASAVQIKEINYPSKKNPPWRKTANKNQYLFNQNVTSLRKKKIFLWKEILITTKYFLERKYFREKKYFSK